jgi:hypothetical protein
MSQHAIERKGSSDIKPAPAPTRERIPGALVAHFMGKRLDGLPRAIFILNLDQRVFQQIRGKKHSETSIGHSPAMKPVPLPEGRFLQVHGDDGPFWTRTDEFGEPLTYVYARDLKRVKIAGMNDLAHEYPAFFAFVSALPDDGLFVLYWTH